MKKVILPLFASIALSSAINAEVVPEVHKLCEDVKDYMGCVKANSKNNSWNPFKKTEKEKKFKNSFQLSKAEKEKWCDYEDLDRENMRGVVDRCIENLEALGPKFSSLGFKNHEE